jgi:hypothetical protein
LPLAKLIAGTFPPQPNCRRLRVGTGSSYSFPAEVELQAMCVKRFNGKVRTDRTKKAE